MRDDREGNLRPEHGEVYVDLDKRNVGFRLVQVEHLFHGERPYAACRILTAGGRPCDFTDTPWLRGIGGVGQLTYIRTDRLTGGRYYRLLTPPPFEAFDEFTRTAA